MTTYLISLDEFRGTDTQETRIVTEADLYRLFLNSNSGAPDFECFKLDAIKAGFVYPIDIQDYLETYVYELPTLLKEYVIQECEKTFNLIPWEDTKMELENIQHEKLKNLTPDTLDLSEYL